MHRFFTAARGGDHRFTVGILLEIPLGQCFVVPAFSGVNNSSRWRRTAFRAFVLRRFVDPAITLVMSSRCNGNNEAAVSVSLNGHIVDSFSAIDDDASSSKVSLALAKITIF